MINRNVRVALGEVTAKKRRELINICVREIYFYSFTDPTRNLITSACGMGLSLT